MTFLHIQEQTEQKAEEAEFDYNHRSYISQLLIFVYTSKFGRLLALALDRKQRSSLLNIFKTKHVNNLLFVCATLVIAKIETCTAHSGKVCKYSKSLEHSKTSMCHLQKSARFLIIRKL